MTGAIPACYYLHIATPIYNTKQRKMHKCKYHYCINMQTMTALSDTIVNPGSLIFIHIINTHNTNDMHMLFKVLVITIPDSL